MAKLEMLESFQGSLNLVPKSDGQLRRQPPESKGSWHTWQIGKLIPDGSGGTYQEVWMLS